MPDIRASRVLQALIANGCAAGSSVTTNLLLNWLEDSGLEDDESLLGVIHAASKGWLAARQDGTVEMTAAGAAVAIKSTH